MPEVSLVSPNQCFADGSSAAAEAEANLSSVQPTAPFGGTDGTEGTESAGSEDLVRRFSDDGAGGSPGSAGAQSAKDPESCVDAAVRALLNCASAVVEKKVGVGQKIAAANCALSLGSLVQCLKPDD